MVEKIKTDMTTFSSGFDNKKKSSIVFAMKWNYFTFLKPEVVYIYLRPFYLIYHFSNFENKILCILDANM